MPASQAERWLPVFAGTLLLCGAPANAAVTCRIHDADQVLRENTRTDGSKTFFVDPNGVSWELVTRTDDPAIRNPGSGRFTPADKSVVLDAIKDVSTDLGPVPVDVYILPYPRRNLLSSSCEGGVIYLSPGVNPYASDQVHALVVHELGHVVHHEFLEETDPRWEIYRELRGITDLSVYNELAPHRNRPHEIFAEDFRVLFGGEEANYSGTFENTDLADPRSVGGLREFLDGLTRETPAPIPDAGRLVASPNPFVPATTLHFTVPAGARDVRLMIVGLDGRLVRRFQLDVAPGDRSLLWDGRDESGAPVAGGIYFARFCAGEIRSVLKLVRRY